MTARYIVQSLCVSKIFITETLLTTCAQPDESSLLIQTSPIMTHSCEGGREFLKAPAKQCIYNNMYYVE